MSNDPVDGGTVTYHRAIYHPDSAHPWSVWFTEDAKTSCIFTAEQGEAMGLTPPERESKAFSVVLDELIVVDPHDDITREQVAESIVGMLEVAGLLRDARQDPQPASDENAPGSATPGEQGAGVTCTPAPDTDTPGDDIDFDALPSRYVRAVGRDGVVRGTFTANGDVAFRRHPDGSVYFDGTQVLPALSPRQHLEALLAGRDDADELIEYAAKHWVRGLNAAKFRLAGAIGDAARGGA